MCEESLLTDETKKRCLYFFSLLLLITCKAHLKTLRYRGPSISNEVVSSVFARFPTTAQKENFFQVGVG